MGSFPRGAGCLPALTGTPPGTRLCLMPAPLHAWWCAALAGSILLGAGKTAEEPVELADTQGGRVRLFDPSHAKGLCALIFVLPDCPVSNAYLPELNRLQREFAKRGVRFYLVYPDPDLAAASARKHALEYQVAFPGLLDPNHRLVRRAGATRAPEAAVFSAAGALLYRGRIDDRYVQYGKKRLQPSRRDLQEALGAALEGKPARWPVVPPVGCDIPHLKETVP
jgi:hypothetical protein